MNMFVHRSLGHFLMNEVEEGGSSAADVEVQEENHEEQQAEEEEHLLLIGDQTPPEPDESESAAAPQWVKDLRKQRREDQKRIKELEREVASTKGGSAHSIPEVGKKPTMEDADIDYDADKFEVALTAWHERKRAADKAVSDQQAAAEQQQQEWQGRLEHYANSKVSTSKKFRDFEEAEEEVLHNMDVTKQGIILQGASDPALLVYALGKNPEEMQRLMKISDPIKFAWEAAQLETKLKTQARKSAPPPEGSVRGSAPISGSVESNLERLRAEAEKTGDYSKVTAYKRQIRDKAKG